MLKEERALFPEKGLINWAEARYSNPDDEYTQKLKQERLKAIRRRNINGIEKIIRIMFIQLSYLRDGFPQEWQVLNKLYQKVTKWLESRKGA